MRTPPERSRLFRDTSGLAEMDSDAWIGDKSIRRITGVRVDAEGGEGDDTLGQGAVLVKPLLLQLELRHIFCG